MCLRSGKCVVSINGFDYRFWSASLRALEILSPARRPGLFLALSGPCPSACLEEGVDEFEHGAGARAR